MRDETEAEWEAGQVDEARLAAARWAIALVDSHPELLDIIPPSRRHYYVGSDGDE